MFYLGFKCINNTILHGKQHQLQLQLIALLQHKTTTYNIEMIPDMMIINYELMFYVLILGFTASIYI